MPLRIITRNQAKIIDLLSNKGVGEYEIDKIVKDPSIIDRIRNFLKSEELARSVVASDTVSSDIISTKPTSIYGNCISECDGCEGCDNAGDQGNCEDCNDCPAQDA